jgi:hypothetical protein
MCHAPLSSSALSGSEGLIVRIWSDAEIVRHHKAQSPVELRSRLS